MFVAASTIGWLEPKEMLQIFSLRLSSSMSYPISVYGIFAVRDYLDPLRNYVFNRTRDDPVIVEQVNTVYFWKLSYISWLKKIP
jgi:hypothetical protein